MLIILASIFAVLLVLGLPIAFTMGIACIGAVIYSGMPMNMMITRMFSAADSFSLMAVPFFILAGELMNEADLTDRILNFARALVGFLRGGLAIVNILASVLFAGLSGSATADTAALGALEIPMMVKDGYSKEFSVAVTVASSTIGPIIPPSVMLVCSDCKCEHIQNIGCRIGSGNIDGFYYEYCCLFYKLKKRVWNRRKLFFKKCDECGQGSHCADADASYYYGRDSFRYFYCHGGRGGGSGICFYCRDFCL